MKSADKIKLDVEAVAQARIRRELTRAELAEAANCSLRTVWCVHRGMPISFKKARDIAKSLDTPLESLCSSETLKAAM